MSTDNIDLFLTGNLAALFREFSFFATMYLLREHFEKQIYPKKEADDLLCQWKEQVLDTYSKMLDEMELSKEERQTKNAALMQGVNDAVMKLNEYFGTLLD